MRTMDRRSALRSIGCAAAVGLSIALLPKSAQALPVAPKDNVAAAAERACQQGETTTLSARSRRVCWWRRGRRVCRWERWTCWWRRGRRICGWR
jgi:hypothetical protein